jgi:hypothetical protein
VKVRNIFRLLFLDPVPFWIAGAPPLVAVVLLSWLPFAAELNVRIAGYALTLVGIVVVVNGIRRKARLFERPASMLRVRNWLKRFRSIFASPNPQTVSLEGHLNVTMSGSAQVSFTPGPTASLEQRIAVLEQNLKGLTDRLTLEEEHVRKAMADARRAHQQEVSALHSQTQALSVRLTEISAGSLDTELAAVVWVIFGSLYTTFPQEIAKLLHMTNCLPGKQLHRKRGKPPPITPQTCTQSHAP